MDKKIVSIIILVVLLAGSLGMVYSEKRYNNTLQEKYEKILDEINSLKFSYLSNSLNVSVCKAKHDIKLSEGDEIILSPGDCYYTLNLYRGVDRISKDSGEKK